MLYTSAPLFLFDTEYNGFAPGLRSEVQVTRDCFALEENIRKYLFQNRLPLSTEFYFSMFVDNILKI